MLPPAAEHDQIESRSSSKRGPAGHGVDQQVSRSVLEKSNWAGNVSRVCSDVQLSSVGDCPERGSKKGRFCPNKCKGVFDEPEVASLRMIRNELETANEALQSRVAELERKSADWMSTAASLQAENRELQMTTSELTEKIAVAQSDVESASTLREDLKKKDAEVMILMSEISKLRQTNAKAHAQPPEVSWRTGQHCETQRTKKAPTSGGLRDRPPSMGGRCDENGMLLDEFSSGVFPSPRYASANAEHESSQAQSMRPSLAGESVEGDSDPDGVDEGLREQTFSQTDLLSQGGLVERSFEMFDCVPQASSLNNLSSGSPSREHCHTAVQTLMSSIGCDPGGWRLDCRKSDGLAQDALAVRVQHELVTWCVHYVHKHKPGLLRRHRDVRDSRATAPGNDFESYKLRKLAKQRLDDSLAGGRGGGGAGGSQSSLRHSHPGGGRGGGGGGKREKAACGVDPPREGGCRPSEAPALGAGSGSTEGCSSAGRRYLWSLQDAQWLEDSRLLAGSLCEAVNSAFTEDAGAEPLPDHHSIGGKGSGTADGRPLRARAPNPAHGHKQKLRRHSEVSSDDAHTVAAATTPSHSPRRGGAEDVFDTPSPLGPSTSLSQPSGSIQRPVGVTHFRRAPTYSPWSAKTAQGGESCRDAATILRPGGSRPSSSMRRTPLPPSRSCRSAGGGGGSTARGTEVSLAPDVCPPPTVEATC